MKRLAVLLSTCAASLLAWLTHESWWPPLRDGLLHDDNATLLQGVAALIAIGTALIGVIFWIGRSGRSDPPGDPNLPPHSGATAEGVYVTGRDFTPSPESTAEIDDAVNPYLGLRAFRREDAARFFGREREIGEALDEVGTPLRAAAPGREERCRWLQVEGNSGAGKSSLVNAGLLPRIEAGALAARTGFTEWCLIGPMLPGEKPLRRLAEALQRGLIDDEKDRDTRACEERLERDPEALSYLLRSDFGREGRAFVLVIDQFEELFTFSDPVERRHLDAQLAHALRDAECPLFLIGTVRIDFLHGFEHLPQLSELYNTHCRRYLLKTISREGLREAIEGPAKRVGLDVREITEAMLRDAENEPGALPLVENALHHLWERRDGNRLRGTLYTEAGGLFGLLEWQADALLRTIDDVLPEGRTRALELLLALTRVSDQGNHSRRRLSIEEARMVAAGKRRDPEAGQRVIDWLAGRPGPADRRAAHGNGDIRLVTILSDSGVPREGGDESGAKVSADDEITVHVDLIHEMLIRPCGRDPETNRQIGYWRTLYDYIERNRDRSFYRDRLARQTALWRASRGLGRWRGLAGWGDLWRYRWFHPGPKEPEHRYKRASRNRAVVQGLVLAVLVGVPLQAYLWTLLHGLPPSYVWTLQSFRLARLGVLDEPLPAVIEVPSPPETVMLGERDAGFIAAVESQSEFMRNFGVPAAEGRIEAPFAIGVTEVSYVQFDYHVYSRRRDGDPVEYPAGAPGDNARGPRAVVNVSWNDANDYLEWLSVRTGEAYRLPTEAEWEYAARAGTETTYWWGDEAGSGHANCDGCGSEWDNRRVALVASFAANPWGLHDTAGNVWEWTCSVWQTSFDGSESRCAEQGDTQGGRALRGGSWDTVPDWVRSSSRDGNDAGNRYNSVGFRVLRAARTP